MPPLDKQAQLEELIAAVLASSKYKAISPLLVRRIARQELERRRTPKEALKETKNKLHQVAGAYLESREQSQQWLQALRATLGDTEALKATCRTIMSHHASTRERLPILDTFYDTLFAALPPIHSIMDIACGLNPLALPWMPLQGLTTYYAYDIYQYMADMLQEWFQLLQLQGHAHVRDIVQECPTTAVDLALVLKTLPCLEQTDKHASHHLLHTLNARYILVSYPLQSLGGRGKGMLNHYEHHFKELMTGQPWTIQRFEFSTELAFLIEKP